MPAVSATVRLRSQLPSLRCARNPVYAALVEMPATLETTIGAAISRWHELSENAQASCSRALDLTFKRAEARGIYLPPERRRRFLTFVAACIKPDEPADSIAGRCLDDMLIAFEAGNGAAAAIAHISELIYEHASAWTRAASERRDDIVQAVLVRLLVAEGQLPPKILSYRGTAALRTFLKVVVTRASISEARTKVAQSSLSMSYKIVAPAHDPEVEALRAKYGPQFRSALAATLAELSVDDRTLLKLHYRNGVNVNDLAVMQGVHRVTLSRRLSQIRDHVFQVTRERFRVLLQVSESEFASIVRLVASDIDLELSSVQ
jgi:RNA polymerase sigma-70 factor, ECF subfamily